MTMSQKPAGTSLSWEEVSRIMAPETYYKLDRVDVTDEDGTQQTHSFNPPYKLEPGFGYSFWVAEDGTPQCWQIEQRKDHAIYWVKEAERLQVAAELH